MAVAPLFVANYATLKSRLRLSGVPEDDAVDASMMIDEAVRTARVRFYRDLSEARIAQILTYTEIDNPTTTNQVIRLCASQCEVKIVYVDLLSRLRAMFLDNSAEAGLALQAESILRDASSEEIEARFLRLNNDIEADMDLLRGTTEVGEEETMKITTMEPDYTNPLPGDSVFNTIDLGSGLLL